MFCEKCGNLIPEGLTECPNCNPTVENETQDTEVVAQEAPIGETTVLEAEPTAEPETFAEPSFEEAPVKVKKGKKGLALGGIIASVVAVAVAVAVFFNFSFIQGFWIKTFSSDEEYFAFVEKKALSSLADYTTDFYGTAFESLSTDSYAYGSTVELNISDEAIAIIEDALPEEYDSLELNNYKNIRMGLKGSFTADKFALDASLGLGANSLLDLSTILDMTGRDAYIGVTNLSNKYLVFEDVLEELDDAALNSLLSEVDFEKLSKALPSEEILNSVLNKYLGIALENMGSVTKDSDKFEIGDYSEKLTILEKKVTEKDLLKASKALLKELKTDSDVKDIINDVEMFILDEYEDMLDGSGYEKGDFYDSFKDAIKAALDELDDVEASRDELFTLVDYVNGSHEIVGRAITVDDEEIISYMSVHEGNNFAFKLVCEEAELLITGEGTDKNDVIDADYTVEVEGTEVVDITLESFSFKDNKINGSVTVAPSSDLLSTVVGDSTANSMLSLLEPAIKVSFEMGDTSGKVTYAVLSKNKEFVSMSVSASTTSNKTVEIPTDAMNSEEIMEWVDTIDVDKAVNVIKSLKLPSEINDLVDTYAASIKDAGGIGAFVESMMNGFGSSYDDYYDDYSDYGDSYDDYYDDYSDYGDSYDDYYDDYSDYGDSYDDYYDSYASYDDYYDYY